MTFGLAKSIKIWHQIGIKEMANLNLYMCVFEAVLKHNSECNEIGCRIMNFLTAILG